jgi:hypothetical protein
LTRFSPTVPSNDTARLALTQWTRSAAQRNVDALVKVGDYYYHGLGDPEDDEATRFEKAARYYRSAADTQVSALAMWNLGWMYENGVGVPQVIIFYFMRAIHTHMDVPRRLCRTSTLPKDIMTWPWRRTPKLTYPSPFHSSNYMRAAFGIPSKAARMALTCGISMTKQVSLILSARTPTFIFLGSRSHEATEWRRA